MTTDTERKDIVGTLLNAAFDLLARYPGAVLFGTLAGASILIGEIMLWIDRARSPRERLQDAIDNAATDDERRNAREQLHALDVVEAQLRDLKDQMEAANGKGITTISTERKGIMDWLGLGRSDEDNEEMARRRSDLRRIIITLQSLSGEMETEAGRDWCNSWARTLTGTIAELRSDRRTHKAEDTQTKAISQDMRWLEWQVTDAIQTDNLAAMRQFLEQISEMDDPRSEHDQAVREDLIIRLRLALNEKSLRCAPGAHAAYR